MTVRRFGSMLCEGQKWLRAAIRLFRELRFAGPSEWGFGLAFTRVGVDGAREGGLLLLACLGAACSAEAPLPEATGATCPEDSTVTYAGFVQGFMDSYCASCHAAGKRGAERQGAPSDHNFDTLYDLSANAEHIDAWAGSGPRRTNTAMPPAGEPAPSVHERKQLSEWLACQVTQDRPSQAQGFAGAATQ